MNKLLIKQQYESILLSMTLMALEIYHSRNESVLNNFHENAKERISKLSQAIFSTLVLIGLNVPNKEFVDSLQSENLCGNYNDLFTKIVDEIGFEE